MRPIVLHHPQGSGEETRSQRCRLCADGIQDFDGLFAPDLRPVVVLQTVGEYLVEPRADEIPPQLIFLRPRLHRFRKIDRRTRFRLNVVIAVDPGNLFDQIDLLCNVVPEAWDAELESFLARWCRRQVQPTEMSSDAIDGAGLLRLLVGDPHRLTDPGVTARTPKVKRMPEGIEVLERQVGLAAGQWVLRVRCQCGRSWFEVEEVHWATCPRCSLLVRVAIDAVSR